MQLKKRMIIVCAVLGVVTAGIGGGIGVPSLLTARTDLLRYAKARLSLETRFAIHAIMSKANSDLAATKKRVAPLAEMAIEDGEELRFITAIEAIAKKNGVTEKLDLITVNQKTLTPWEREVPLRIAAAGAFPNVMRFMGEIERLPSLVVVNGVQMSPLTAGEDGGTVTMTLDGYVYVLGSEAPDFVHGKAEPLKPSAPDAAPAPAPAAPAEPKP